MDAVGGLVLTAGIPSIAPQGRIILYGILIEGQTVQLTNPQRYDQLLVIKGFGVDHLLEHHSVDTGYAQNDELIHGLLTGNIRFPAFISIPFDQALSLPTNPTNQYGSPDWVCLTVMQIPSIPFNRFARQAHHQELIALGEAGLECLYLSPDAFFACIKEGCNNRKVRWNLIGPAEIEELNQIVWPPDH
ncbi:hypothetical protein ACFQ4C_26010 [Larkinella insperata]|uniref:Uncharacterized protein n=1 Tax=Larkinella insperata TaxID=332158 RepID=A0ABW3QJ89_9BACT